jgi:hypothetical protein
VSDRNAVRCFEAGIAVDYIEGLRPGMDMKRSHRFGIANRSRIEVAYIEADVTGRGPMTETCSSPLGRHLASAKVNSHVDPRASTTTMVAVPARSAAFFDGKQSRCHKILPGDGDESCFWASKHAGPASSIAPH